MRTKIEKRLYKILIFQRSDCTELLKYLEESKRFEVIFAENMDDIYIALINNFIDACILDFGETYDTKMAYIKKVRNVDESMPILLLTSSPYNRDVIDAFRCGVDMYVSKPYGYEELMYRIIALINRSETQRNIHKNDDETYFLGNFTLDYKRRLLIDSNGEEIEIEKKYAEILKFMILYNGEVIQKADLLKYLWGSCSYQCTRNLDVAMTYIRRLMANCSKKITSIRGLGYIIEDK